jgi:hypothetical protein
MACPSEEQGAYRPLRATGTRHFRAETTGVDTREHSDEQNPRCTTWLKLCQGAGLARAARWSPALVARAIPYDRPGQHRE